MRKLFVQFLLAAVMIFAGFAIAQAPVENVDPNKHPNLAEAQKLCQQAYQKIDVAQKDNKEDMEGHAEKAKQLISEADKELSLAAQAANKNANKANPPKK
jgi:hypothetical protein